MPFYIAENPIDNTVLIKDANSSEWGEYLYEDPSDRPAEVTKWYDILCQHNEEVVHFWRQFRLDADCLVIELKKQVFPRPVKEDCAPILSFKEDYPILFECLDAVFGLMMSNSMQVAIVDRLQCRERIRKVTVQKFWKELNVGGKVPDFKVLWMSTIKSFPHLLRFHRGGVNGIITSRTVAMTVIGKYLTMLQRKPPR